MQRFFFCLLIKVGWTGWGIVDINQVNLAIVQIAQDIHLAVIQTEFTAKKNDFFDFIC